MANNEPTPTVPQPFQIGPHCKVAHDGSAAIDRGTEYVFNAPLQRQIMVLLAKAALTDLPLLSETSIRQQLGRTKNLRVIRIFSGHPAMTYLVMKVGLCYRLRPTAEKPSNNHGTTIAESNRILERTMK